MAHKPELLSPAGSMEALRAAVQNGADAVYMGGQRYNARSYASNFDDRELEQAMQYAHLRGVRIYVTFNTLISDEELGDAVHYLEYLYNIGADAVIVQDLGLAALAKRYFPGMQVHASTQMTIYSPEGALLLKDAGIDRVVAARELRLEEVLNIKRLSGLPVEVFVQGALCMSYSGQCLMSSLIGGRSGNRGKCAQPCRKWYRVVDRDRGGRTVKEGYLLSPRDLFTLDRMDTLLRAGIDSFKIEGRMKRPEYVAAATRVYRRAIDNYLEKGSIGDTSEGKDLLLRVFNRGFTAGFVLGGEREGFLSHDRPDNRGVPVGVIAGAGAGRVEIRLSDRLNIGDGIELDTGSGRAGTRVTSMSVNGKPVEKGSKGQVAEIEFKKRVVVGSVVFKTYDRELMEDLASSYKEDSKRIPVYCAASFRKGLLPEIRLWDDRGGYVTVRGDRPVEPAEKVAMDGGRISEQLAKTGGTPFVMEQITVDADKGIYISVSEINNLRRKALEQLGRIRAGTDREPVGTKELITSLEQQRYRRAGRPNDRIRLTVETGSPSSAELFARSGADRVVLRCFEKDEEEYSVLHRGLPLYVKFPLVTDREDIERITGLIERLRHIIHGIEISNPGHLAACGEYRGDVEIIAGQGFNIFNRLSAAKVQEWGCSGAVLSPELTLKQVRDIALGSEIYCEAAVHGRQRLMTIRYPVLEGLGKGSYGLMDSKGFVFPVFQDETGRTEVSNSQPLFMLDKMEDLRGTGIGGIRLIHLDEEAEEFAYLVENYRKAADGEPYDRDLVERYIASGITRGHFYRGV